MNNSGSSTAETCHFDCTSGDGCTDGNFDFSADFTCGFWQKPSAPTSGDTFAILGTNRITPSSLTAGWEVYRLDANVYDFVTFDGTDMDGVVTTSTPANGTQSVVTVMADITAQGIYIFLNGVQEATTPPGAITGAITATADFQLLGSNTGTVASFGSIDHIWCFNRALAATSRCRVEVCGIDGSLCTCNGNAYVSKPKHSGSGGPINCTLPSCDLPTPAYLN